MYEDPVLETLVDTALAANLDLLFPGFEVVDSFPFRVTRDADLEIEEDEAADLLTAMEEVVGHDPALAQDMRLMGGLRRHMPVTAITFLIGCVAISGIPPLAGFWSKDLILDALAELRD